MAKLIFFLAFIQKLLLRLFLVYWDPEMSRKFLSYFAFHFSKYRLHPRFSIIWYSATRNISEICFFVSLPGSAHCNTCCWTKIKGGEAGQVSLSVPVALPVPCHLGDSWTGALPWMCHWVAPRADRLCGRSRATGILSPMFTLSHPFPFHYFGDEGGGWEDQSLPPS